MPHISLAAEKIGFIGPLPVTNSLLATWSVMAILILFGWLATRNLSLVPSKIQSIAEVIIDGMYSFFSSILGHQTKQVFPLVATLFLFIIVANWEGLLPGFGTIGFNEEVKPEVVQEQTVVESPKAEEKTGEVLENAHAKVATTHETAETEIAETTKEEGSAQSSHTKTKFLPLLRGATADLNMTVALAIIAVIAVQYFGFLTLGFHYSKRFLNFANPILFFVGLLEIISDLSKVISFAFRLFGNIFAGEVLLTVMAFLMPFVAPMPFLMLELFVGFIQAVVFSTLTSVFVNVAASHEG